MNQRDIILGGIALAVGLLIGLLFGPRGPGAEEIEAALDERFAALENAGSGIGQSISTLQSQMDERTAALQTQMEETTASVPDQIEALSVRIEELETAVSEGAASQAAMAETLSQEVGGRIDALGAAVSEQALALESGLEGFRQSLAMDGVASDGAAGPDDQGQTETAEAAQPEDAGEEQSPDEEGFVGIGPGQSAIFADGDLRAFVSRVDSGAGIARLSVNGSTTAMEVGDTLGLTLDDGTYCRMTVSGIQQNQVAINAGCGDELGEPEGVLPGNVMLLEDGAVRVFVSGVSADGDAARIAVNGVDTETVQVGNSVAVTVEDRECEVGVDDIDRGHVALSASCG